MRTVWLILWASPRETKRAPAMQDPPRARRVLLVLGLHSRARQPSRRPRRSPAQRSTSARTCVSAIAHGLVLIVLVTAGRIGTGSRALHRCAAARPAIPSSHDQHRDCRRRVGQFGDPRGFGGRRVGRSPDGHVGRRPRHAVSLSADQRSPRLSRRTRGRCRVARRPHGARSSCSLR